MIELAMSADEYRLRDGVVEFVFRRVTDRWQHGVSTLDGNGWVRLIESVEGRPDDAVLPSPALQDLRFEQLSEGAVEFQLMGQSGKGVYSAAVRFETDTRTLDFDICARGRTGETPPVTVSTYRLALPDARLADGITILESESHAVRIMPVSIDGQPTADCRLSDEVNERRLMIGCIEGTRPQSSGKAFSIRWRYRMEIAGRTV